MAEKEDEIHSTAEDSPLLVDSSDLDEKETFRLAKYERYAYGLGHICNDVCAAMWFSYALIFYQIVIGFPPVYAGYLLFIGQTVDAMATPVVGTIIDRKGSRRAWHLFGSSMVCLSFPLIFNPRFATLWVQFIYYAACITIFQISWALVQISHLSLIPELTHVTEERAELTSIRYMSSVCSNIMVYVFAWLFLHDSMGMRMDLIGPADSYKFQSLSFVVTFTGVIGTLLFHCFVHEKGSSASISNPPSNNQTFPRTESQYCCQSELYKVATLYTASRLFLTISMVYIPLYVNEAHVSDSGTLASVPLVSYIASLGASLLMRHQKSVFTDNSFNYFVGTLACIFGCLFVYFNPRSEETIVYIYIAAGLFGVGSAITTVVSLCITANLVGPNTERGAFVYSLVTFADKLLNGLAIVIIEFLKCDKMQMQMSECAHYYRDVLALVNGVLSVIGYLVLLTLPNMLLVSS
nr:PREDICTED: major facilitator superfamily domain-containing protein 12-like isoform X1 [Bemisia tabaci]